VFSVPRAAGEANVVFAFHYVSGGDEFWWAIDNVEVTGTEGCPAFTASIEGATEASTGGTVHLTSTTDASAPATYAWTIESGSGEIVGSSTGAAVDVRGTADGEVVVRLEVRDSCGKPKVASHTIAFTTGEGGTQKPFDENQDGKMDISDAVAVLNFLFTGSNPTLPCGDGLGADPANIQLLDANGDNKVDLSDPVRELGFLFLGNPRPVSCVDDNCPCIIILGCPKWPRTLQLGRTETPPLGGCNREERRRRGPVRRTRGLDGRPPTCRELISPSAGTRGTPGSIARCAGRPTTPPARSSKSSIGRAASPAAGIYNRKSQIAVRLLTEDPAQPLDDAFFEAALDRAIAFRKDTLQLETLTDAYRAINSEGDGLSGLVADRFADFVVVELFSAGWYRKLGWLLPALSRRFHGATALVRADRTTEEREGFRVRDFVAEKLGAERLRTIVKEGPLRFHVDLHHGHKTGLFCDQREHRLRVGALARGKRMLDGCTYTGGFALHAAAGGATEVTAVDLDEKAVAVGEQNARLNRLPVTFHHADLFDYLREAAAARRTWDLVVLDPPKLAASARQSRRRCGGTGT
jgi:23S rRNA G2069 N7-methylase RlmK/C1962 C5-methylase RlmI